MYLYYHVYTLWLILIDPAVTRFSVRNSNSPEFLQARLHHLHQYALILYQDIKKVKVALGK